MEAQITLTLSQILIIVGSVAVPMAGAIALLYKRGEARTKTIIHLTESVLTVTKDNTKALENNTTVIEKLPEQFVLHLKANGR
jgi:membrane-bound lytic murein transglycosylase MltF